MSNDNKALGLCKHCNKDIHLYNQGEKTIVISQTKSKLCIVYICAYCKTVHTRSQLLPIPK